MKLKILNNAATRFGGVGLKVKAASPEIFIGVGIGCVVAGTIFACKATLNADKVLEEKNETIEKINSLKAAVDDENNTKYTKDDYSDEKYRKDICLTYARMAGGFIRLYGPSMIFMGLGIASILHGHGIITRRNLALAAAYETVKEGYSEYRKRVVDELGEDADKKFKYGIQKKDIEYEEEQEDGTVKKKTKKNAEVLEGYSKNAKFFDSASQYWCKSPEYNLLFLRERQEYANNLLHSRGHLFLNEVYDMLGIPRTEEGQVEGWKADGVGFVDFGIYELYREAARDFVNGYENVILLDFNTDGNILDVVFKK